MGGLKSAVAKRIEWLNSRRGLREPRRARKYRARSGADRRAPWTNVASPGARRAITRLGTAEHPPAIARGGRITQAHPEEQDNRKMDNVTTPGGGEICASATPRRARGRGWTRNRAWAHLASRTSDAEHPLAAVGARSGLPGRGAGGENLTQAQRLR